MPKPLSANTTPESLDRVLLPVEVSGPVSLQETVIEMVRSSKVVLLGYWSIPDQSSADQHRDQFGKEAEKRLQAVGDRLSSHGIEFQKEVVFTKNRGGLIDDAANKYDCQSVVLPGTEEPSSRPTRGIVLVKPNADLDRIVTTLSALFADSDVELLLFHAAKNKNKHLYDSTEYMLRGLAGQLTERGIDSDRIEWEQSIEGERLEMILSRVPDFDFVVLGESDPSIRARIFGTVQARLAEETEKTQLTIRTSI
ncbi:hypothetical protein [Halanaeroarchaeum sulfurireducens]|uniref:UspA domain-containing protein n=1 Tax=Halanaeroarchaeum sulfurireducens TaxID=1604004 RepID=A0A0F7PEB8_9EURY|nr:hypothetical protein [Halanaeroarchaeum sulfurireducens]AKH97964.1 UspA domain-containing protein [Halanaeroarchaeum sulfurireducens]ALG82358.1 UspA domain-containing protein [Halanaeroarchaeum sulfurireducens]